MACVPTTFTILTVCTANVCRSALAEALIRQWADAHPAAGVSVSSAGVDAEPGLAMCPQAREFQKPAHPHAARRLESADLERADLVLVADRTHRAAAARLAPSTRPRLFTMTQAAGLAELVAATIRAGALPEGAPPLPSHATARLNWLIAEMDAARGTRAGLPEAADDIDDDHGWHAHDATLARVAEATGLLTAAMATVLKVH